MTAGVNWDGGSGWFRGKAANGETVFYHQEPDVDPNLVMSEMVESARIYFDEKREPFDLSQIFDNIIVSFWLDFNDPRMIGVRKTWICKKRPRHW